MNVKSGPETNTMKGILSMKPLAFTVCVQFVLVRRYVTKNGRSGQVKYNNCSHFIMCLYRNRSVNRKAVVFNSQNLLIVCICLVISYESTSPVECVLIWDHG